MDWHRGRAGQRVGVWTSLQHLGLILNSGPGLVGLTWAAQSYATDFVGAALINPPSSSTTVVGVAGT